MQEMLLQALREVENCELDELYNILNLTRR